MNEPAWAGSFAIIMVISSAQNPKYKFWHSLLKKKYRDKEGMFLLEGPLLIKDCLSGGGVIKEAIVNSSVLEPDELLAEAGLSEDQNVYLLDDKLFNELSQTETSRTIIGVFSKPEWKKEDLATDKDILVLDSLQDPGNVGTMIRTAEAGGFGGIIASKGTVDVFSPKVVRASAGSVVRMPIITGLEYSEIIELVNELGKTGIAAMGEGDREYWDCDFAKPLAIIIGNEGAGLSKEMGDFAEIKVRIPMEGDIESLNAAMAAGILIYEAKKQKHK